MSVKNRKLVEFYAEQGATAGEQPSGGARTSAVNAEQMRRAEERMANSSDAKDAGVSDVAAADTPRATPNDTDTVRRRADG